MNRVRKFALFFLSLILLVSLLFTAFSTSASIAFKNPNKVETWLNKSNLYSRFVSNTISEAIKASGSSQNQSSLAYTAVQQAASTSFTRSLFQKSVETVLNSNYAWLEGKVPQPSFTINLSSEKNSFAQQVGSYVAAQINNLPACNAAQLSSLSSGAVDPLNATCAPPGLNAQTEASLVTQKIQNSPDFLKNPVITPNNINPNGSNGGRPYYERFSKAPKLYKAFVSLPWIYGLISIISVLGVIFVAPRKRKGLERIGIIFALDGIILIVIKLLSGTILKRIQKQVFKNSSTEQIHQALISFMSQAEKQLVMVYLLFGIIFLILAIAILTILMSTRTRMPKIKKITLASPQRVNKSSGAIGDRLRSNSRTNSPPKRKLPPKGPPKPPNRLIQ